MKHYFLFCFLFFLGKLQGQEPYTINYKISDGLPTNTVYSSFQDSRGFIWFATDVGILKYDSKNFILLNTDSGLTDNEVFKIKEDYKGRKWLLTLNGVPTFIKDDKIYNEENSSLINQIKSKSMFIDFYEDKDKKIYLVSRNGEVNIIDKNDNVKQLNNSPNNTSGIWKVGEEPSILNSSGIYNPIKNEFKKNTVSRMPLRVYHHKEETYYSDFNTLNKVLPKGEIKEIIKLKINVEIVDIFKETDTKIWLCTRKGVFLFEDNKIVKHYFKDKTVTSISKDFEDNYWITTLNNGVFLVPSFQVLEKKIGINTIAEKNKNEIWFGGTENDFYIKKNNFFVKKEFNKKWRKDAISNIRFLNNAIYVIGKTGTKIIYPNKVKEVKININDLLEKGDTLFLATMYTSKISKKNLEEYSYDNRNLKRVLDSRTNVLEKVKKSIYIGTNIGLYKYTYGEKLIYLGDEFNELKSSVNSLLYDNENNLLLVATSSKGLILLDNKKVKNIISNKDGLNNNTVNSIEKIKINQYLIGTNKGVNLLSIEKDGYKISNYNPALLLKNQKINSISYTNDTTYIGTNERLIYFHHSYFHQKNKPPAIYINDVYVDKIKTNKKYLKQISYDKSNIKINYTGISFLDEGNLEYYYQLNNDGWNRTNENQVIYQSLPSGSYTFSIYAINGFKKRSLIKKISFHIEVPFWESWWFLLAITSFFIFLIYCLVKLRFNYIQKQFKKEKKSFLLEKENILLENQMLALEQKALRLQMNPHFIFNALNTIKGYYSEGNLQEASNYISNFSKLLRLLLENVDQYISLFLEVEMLDLYLQLTKVRYQNKFSYKIIIDEKLDSKETIIPTLLLQPIIENAVIHGVSPKSSKGKIIISFFKKDTFLVCRVKDDGIGREASQKKRKTEHNSKAISIIKERLELIEIQEKVNCKLQFVDLKKEGKSKGTEVIITIPHLKI